MHEMRVEQNVRSQSLGSQTERSKQLPSQQLNRKNGQININSQTTVGRYLKEQQRKGQVTERTKKMFVSKELSLGEEQKRLQLIIASIQHRKVQISESNGGGTDPNQDEDGGA